MVPSASAPGFVVTVAVAVGVTVGVDVGVSVGWIVVGGRMGWSAGGCICRGRCGLWRTRLALGLVLPSQ